MAFYDPQGWYKDSSRSETSTRDTNKMTSTENKGVSPPADPSALTPAEQKTVLRLARDTLDSYVRSRKVPEAGGGDYTLTPVMREDRGAFVTLKKHGKLRGCIGYIMP